VGKRREKEKGGRNEGEGKKKNGEKEKKMEKKMEKEKEKWKRKGKKEKKREREKREREIRAALIAASTAGPVGRAQWSRVRADEATGKRGRGCWRSDVWNRESFRELGFRVFSRILSSTMKSFWKKKFSAWFNFDKFSGCHRLPTKHLLT